jgi:hypothetical protein
MTRAFADVGISFVRTRDGLSLLLDSQKWTLERGKVYSVRLTAGSQSIEAKALAETKGVTITLADQPFNEKLRVANLLEVRGGPTKMKEANAPTCFCRAAIDIRFKGYRNGGFLDS